MRRIITYPLLLAQVIIIVVLVYQFEHIDQYADEITIETTLDYVEYFEFVEHTDLYVEYDINKIDDETWKISEEVEYNELLYVTLVKNKAGIHEVKAVTKQKPKDLTEHDVIVRANYSHEDEQGKQYVTYGFESIENSERFGTFKNKDHIQVTILLGKWGQQKIIDVTTVH